MKITVIHGQSHKGSTYNVTRKIIDKISSDSDEIYEYFLPVNGPSFCVGCYKCFFEDENSCPQAQKVQPIVKSIEISDIIVIDSPTYALSMTGQLKTFLDHLSYMWLSHRPNKTMFKKVGIVVSTTAGAGAGKVTKDLAKQMFFLGIPKVFKYSKKVSASSWKEVSDKIKESIETDTSKLSKSVKAKVFKSRPGFKLRFMFMIMSKMQKANNWNLIDKNYWQKNGWLDGKKPW